MTWHFLPVIAVPGIGLAASLQCPPAGVACVGAGAIAIIAAAGLALGWHAVPMTWLLLHLLALLVRTSHG